PFVGRRARVDQPEPSAPLAERLMAVAEADHVHLVLREGARAPIARGPAPPVAVHEAQADGADGHDLAPAEACHELWRVVVASHGLQRRECLEELGDAGAREITEVHDELHALVAKAVAKRCRKLGAEARQMGVGHDTDLHALTVAWRPRGHHLCHADWVVRAGQKGQSGAFGFPGPMFRKQSQRSQLSQRDGTALAHFLGMTTSHSRGPAPSSKSAAGSGDHASPRSRWPMRWARKAARILLRLLYRVTVTGKE